MAVSLSKAWAVVANDKYLGYVQRDTESPSKGILRVMRGSVLIGEKEVIVNAPGPFGPHPYDNGEWCKAVTAIVTEYEEAEAKRNK